MHINYVVSNVITPVRLILPQLYLLFLLITEYNTFLSFFSGKNKKDHIKKPLNAFMLYMKEMRPVVQAECTLKESAAINQILGRRVNNIIISDLYIKTHISTLSVHIYFWKKTNNHYRNSCWSSATQKNISVTSNLLKGKINLTLVWLFMGFD